MATVSPDSCERSPQHHPGAGQDFRPPHLGCQPSPIRRVRRQDALRGLRGCWGTREAPARLLEIFSEFFTEFFAEGGGEGTCERHDNRSPGNPTPPLCETRKSPSIVPSPAPPTAALERNRRLSPITRVRVHVAKLPHRHAVCSKKPDWCRPTLRVCCGLSLSPLTPTCSQRIPGAPLPLGRSGSSGPSAMRPAPTVTRLVTRHIPNNASLARMPVPAPGAATRPSQTWHHGSNPMTCARPRAYWCAISRSVTRSIQRHARA